MTDFERERLQEPDRTEEDLFNSIYPHCVIDGTLDEVKLRDYCQTIAEKRTSEQISHYGGLKWNNQHNCHELTDSKTHEIYLAYSEQECFGYLLEDHFRTYQEEREKRNEELLNKAEQAIQEEKGIPQLCCVADVEKKEIQFLIEPYIIKNNITAIVGDGGVGKTFVWVDIASAISNGKLPAIMGVPFETKKLDSDNHKVLYFTSEDNTAETLKERFEMAGADLKNLQFVPLEDRHFTKITLESDTLEELIKQAKPALCVLDPLQSFVKGKMIDRNNIRRQLDCLTRLASVYNVSFLIIVHTNKSATSDPRTKLSDSSDIWDKCRSILFVGTTKEKNVRFLSQEKGNYTKEDNELATQLFSIKQGKIENVGTTDKKYREFMTESTFSKDTTIRDDAKDVILNTLQEKEMRVSELDESLSAYGISKKTLERAKAELKKEKKILYRRKADGQGKGVQWYVSLIPNT